MMETSFSAAASRARAVARRGRSRT
jgi:hypothetical protein